MKKLLTLLLAIVATTALWAEDFEVDGIYYKILTGREVAVTYRGSSYSDYNNRYSGSVTIPSTVTYNGTTYSVTSIGEYAFYECSSLTSVTIPNSVTSIGEAAFMYCSGLTSVTIGNSVTSIGDEAFCACFSLTSVTIPNSVTSIGYMAFYGCSSLTMPVYNAHCFAYLPTSYEGAYTIPEGIKQIAGGAFASCESLTSVTIGNSVTNIGEYAFGWCSGLTSVTIPNSVTSIGEGAFCACSSLTSVTIPNSVTSIGDGAFCACSGLTSVTIPNSVTSIGYEAFDGCSGLTSVIVEKGNTVYDSRENCNAIIETAINTLIVGCQNTIIPNSVTSIGVYAFRYCSGLTSVTIPNSVTSIGNLAFMSCSSLTSIESLAETPPTLGAYAFYNVSTSIPVYVPCSSVSAYQSAEGWKDFTNIQCMPEDESAVDNVHSQSTNCQKILRDGQLLIIRDGKTYNAQGVEL